MSTGASGRVGIIGAGRLGQAIARTAVRTGRSVVIANSRGPDSLTSVVSETSPSPTARIAGSASGPDRPDHESSSPLVTSSVPSSPWAALAPPMSPGPRSTQANPTAMAPPSIGPTT
jgi:predicted dinucleotide-binding enzyme